MSELRVSRFSSVSFAAAAVVTVAALALSGCGVNELASPAASQGQVAISGTVFGGSIPIGSSSVSLWETDVTNAGYPSANNENAKLVQTVTAGALGGNNPGGFSFNAFTCDAQTAKTTGGTANGTATAGPFLYLTAIGGDTGNGNNPNVIMVNALGPCSYLEANRTNLKVTVNEATTVAAALGLGHFMYVDPAVPGVYINAPANNNAVKGSCTTGTSMVCVAAGLSHGFANAFNLVDGEHFDGTTPGGGGRSSIVANPMTGSAANANAVVPSAQINALANVLQSCTNSAGGSGTGGSTGGSDGSTCGNLFNLAQSAAAVVPTDTTTAAINIVQNPFHNVSTLFALIPSQIEFGPSLTAAPHDWSFGIFYPGTVASFSQPQAVALDANDNVYVPAILAASSNPVNGSLTSFNSAGAQLWTTGNNTTICGVGTVATDTVGNVWVANYTSSSYCTTGVAGLYGFTEASTGSAVAPSYSFTNASTENVQGATWAVAVDRANDLWYGKKNSTCSTTAGTGANTNPVCVAEIPYNGGSYGAQTNLQTFASGAGIQGTPLVNDIALVVDAGQNVWVGSYESGSDTPIGVVPNTGTATIPGYSGGSTPAALTAQPFGLLAIDSSGSAWTGVASSIFHYSLSGTTVGTQTAAVLGNGSITASKPQGGQFDGLGKLWFTSETSSGQIWFFSPAAGAVGATATVTAGDVVPCYLPTTSPQTCTIGSGYARSLQVDSAGSLWVAASGLSIGSSSATGVGSLVQMLGSAAPAWPQLSYANFGAEPQ